MVATVLLVLAAVGIVAAARARFSAGHRVAAVSAGTRTEVDGGAPGAAATHSVGSAASVTLPFRMIAGYHGAPQRDDEGDVWGPDQYFTGGWARHPSKAYIARTGNPLVFRYGRDGDAAYSIPLQPGTYELHLYFMQGSDAAQSEDSENKAIFNVQVNGAVVLDSFEIVSDAMGRNVADERVLRDVSPASDGMLHIQLSTVLGTPSIAAIQILQGKPHQQLPLRMVMQATSYTDRRGQLWRPDEYYLMGRSLSHSVPAAGADDDVLTFERYGHFNYALPVDTRGRYTVTMRFVELYFGTQEAEHSDGRRVFRVLCNGQTLLDDFDVQKEAGSFHVLEKTFYHLKPSAQGKLNLDFEPVMNYATVSAIEVTDESR